METIVNRRLVLGLAAGLSLAWLLLLVAAPVLAPASEGLAAVVYAIGSLICHQRPERSFHLGGHQLPVCARCLGLYAGGAAGLGVWWVRTRRQIDGWSPRRALRVLLVAAVPTAATVATAWLGLGDPANTWRALLALPLGGAAGLIAAAALTDHLK